MNETWEVVIAGKAARQKKKLPETMKKTLELLLKDLRVLGPKMDWPNYGVLKNKAGDVRHCHLTRRKPT